MMRKDHDEDGVPAFKPTLLPVRLWILVSPEKNDWNYIVKMSSSTSPARGSGNQIGIKDAVDMILILES